MSGTLIVGQAVIVVTEVTPGEFSVRSFGTAEGSRAAEELCNLMVLLADAAVRDEGRIAEAEATRPPLGNIRVLPSELLRECVVVWMERAARADHACPRCGLNRTYYVCDQCLGELDAILVEREPRWMSANQERNTDHDAGGAV